MYHLFISVYQGTRALLIFKKGSALVRKPMSKKRVQKRLVKTHTHVFQALLVINLHCSYHRAFRVAMHRVTIAQKVSAEGCQY